MSTEFPIIADLQSKERQWIAQGKQMARALFQRYAADTRHGTPEVMDVIYLAWCRDHQQIFSGRPQADAPVERYDDAEENNKGKGIEKHPEPRDCLS